MHVNAGDVGDMDPGEAVEDDVVVHAEGAGAGCPSWVVTVTSGSRHDEARQSDHAGEIVDGHADEELHLGDRLLERGRTGDVLGDLLQAPPPAMRRR